LQHSWLFSHDVTPLRLHLKGVGRAYRRLEDRKPGFSEVSSYFRGFKEREGRLYAGSNLFLGYGALLLGRLAAARLQ